MTARWTTTETLCLLDTEICLLPVLLASSGGLGALFDVGRYRRDKRLDLSLLLSFSSLDSSALSAPFNLSVALNQLHLVLKI